MARTCPRRAPGPRSRERRPCESPRHPQSLQNPAARGYGRGHVHGCCWERHLLGYPPCRRRRHCCRRRGCGRGRGIGCLGCAGRLWHCHLVPLSIRQRSSRNRPCSSARASVGYRLAHDVGRSPGPPFSAAGGVGAGTADDEAVRVGLPRPAVAHRIIPLASRLLLRPPHRAALYRGVKEGEERDQHHKNERHRERRDELA
mmetsp:Transcript_78907/g.205834  ORF Transcript_78907/g.205834 Transcript_78907/m.205834 type:complete len:201 (+) Transcript_78907:459-1061(+)